MSCENEPDGLLWIEATVHHGLANVLRDAERGDEALASFESALELFDASDEPPVPNRRAALRDFAVLLRGMGDEARAVKMEELAGSL